MPSAHYYVAQINVGRIVAPLHSPAMVDFVNQLPIVNALADSSLGFVWRLQDASGVQAFEDPLVLVNMSVWESVDSLKQFTYTTRDHLGALRDRAKWFERPKEAYLALWWIPAGHTPTVSEAVERLKFRRAHGDTPIAFSFVQPSPPPEGPADGDVCPAVNLDGKVFVSAANTSNGDVNGQTRFHYRQRGPRVWATYTGGPVRFGSLVAVGNREGRLDMRYNHLGPEGAFRTGTCASATEVLPDGRIRLLEEWQWTNGDRSIGRSVLEELRT